MRHALALLFALLIAVTATAAPELTAGNEIFIPGPTWGGGAAANARGSIVAWNDFEWTYIAAWPDVTRRVRLPRWNASGTWYDAAPAIAASPTTFLIVWSETTNTANTYLAIRAAADLTLLDARPIFIASTPREAAVVTPSVVWSGTDWLVTTGSMVSRISLQGAITEQSTYPSPALAAASDEAVFVAYIRQVGATHCGFVPPCSYATFFVTGRLLGSPRAMEEPRLTSAELYRTLLAAAGNDRRFMIASASGMRFGDGVITVATIGADGAVSNEQPLDTTTNVGATPVALAGDGDAFVAAWTRPGAVLHVVMLDGQGRRTSQVLNIGRANETAGPLSLAKIGEGRYLLIYPRSLSARQGVVVRELRLGPGRTRAVRK